MVELGGLCDPEIKDYIKVKYLANMRHGRSAAAHAELPEFNGYAPEQNDGISIRAYLGELHTLEERVISPVMDLAAEWGIALYPATLGTPHITIAEARHTTDTPNGKDDVFEDVANKFDSLGNNRLIGEGIVFDTLWGGGAITLASTLEYPEINELRKSMSNAAKDLSMKYVNYENIVHTTIARIAGHSENPASNAFGRGLMLIQHSLIKSPLVLPVKEVEIMRNDEYNNSHDSQLFGALAARQRK